MSKNKRKLANCRRCGMATRANFRICSSCKSNLYNLKHDLDLLNRYKNEKFLNEPFDEENMLKE